MNLKEIKEIVNLMNENGLVELEMEKDGIRIKLKRAQAGLEFSTGPVIIEKESLPRQVRESAAAQTQKDTSKSLEIKAPMVGTFYRAPSPEAGAYVEENQIVEPGQVICIIEAMKLMNEIKSEIKGKVLEILVDNAEPVEFGQPMFLIEPL